MSTHLQAGPTDDQQFIVLLNSLVSGVVRQQVPDELWIIKIDNWFDHKWLRFSGIGAVDFQFPAFMNRYDGALEEFYQDKLTFPPFTPNRVLGQWSFVRVGEGYVEAALPSLPHPSTKRSSGANLQRRVSDFSRSACFIWYSANTLLNGRGSVMVYGAHAGQVQCWYAGFNQQQGWKLHATKGVSQTHVEQLLTSACEK